MDERAGVGHHLRGGEQAPEAGQLQGQAAAVQARLQVQTQWDLLVDQMPRQGLEGQVRVNAGLTHTSFLPQGLAGKLRTPGRRGTVQSSLQRDGSRATIPSSLRFNPDPPAH